jgi:hypothetical protein
LDVLIDGNVSALPEPAAKRLANLLLRAHEQASELRRYEGALAGIGSKRAIEKAQERKRVGDLVALLDAGKITDEEYSNRRYGFHISWPKEGGR